MFAALGPAALLLAVTLVVVMGVAIQRGATCMVVAVSDLVRRKSAERALAIGWAGIMVLAILGAASLAGLPVPAAPQVAVGWRTLAGGLLLGLGAWVNRACVFGSVARLGQGEWVYLLAPVGLFIGLVAAFRLGGGAQAPVMLPPRPFPDAAALMAPAALLLLLLAGRGWRRAPEPRAGWSWSPTRATAVIGATFAGLMLFAGPWTYTDLLADLAGPGTVEAAGQRLLLSVALLIGAMAGGHVWRKVRPLAPAQPGPWRVLAGSAAMGAGSVLVPGSNDTLLLLGLPFGALHALVALLVMAGTIASILVLQHRAGRRAPRAAG